MRVPGYDIVSDDVVEKERERLSTVETESNWVKVVERYQREHIAGGLTPLLLYNLNTEEFVPTTEERVNGKYH